MSSADDAIREAPVLAVRITSDVLEPAALQQLVEAKSNGAVILFTGTVRNTHGGRRVLALEYSAYGVMAEKMLHIIATEAAERFGAPAITIEHRIGTLQLGEASVAIAVGAPHRGVAFDAARYIIEELKVRVPIWKREHYADGTREWVDPTAAAPRLQGVEN